MKYIHLFLMYVRSFYTNKRSKQSTFVREYRSDASYQLDWEWRSDESENSWDWDIVPVQIRQ